MPNPSRRLQVPPQTPYLYTVPHMWYGQGNISSAATCDRALCRLGRAACPPGRPLPSPSPSSPPPPRHADAVRHKHNLSRSDLWTAACTRYLTDSPQDCLDDAFPKVLEVACS